MFTAGGAARGHYRGRRRAALISFAFSAHPEITVVLVLLAAVGLTVALRTVVSSAQPTSSTRVDGPVASPAAPAPVALPGGSPSTRAKAAKSDPAEPAGAIAPTTSPVPVPSQALISYEAEAPEASRSPGMPIRNLPIASGGRYIARLGDGRTVRFTNVAAEGAGDYTLTIYYLSAEIRTAQLRVDDGPPQLVTFAPSGGWEEVAAIALKVQLLVGLNTIELGNPPGEPSPDLDRVTVQG